MKTMLFLAYVPRGGSCTGSQVRPRKMEQAFCSLGYRVISLWGEPGSASRRAEIRRFSDRIQRESPLFCYAEGPSGPLFYREERKLLLHVLFLKISLRIFLRFRPLQAQICPISVD